jgi:hypothetical protein
MQSARTARIWRYSRWTVKARRKLIGAVQPAKPPVMRQPTRRWLRPLAFGLLGLALGCGGVRRDRHAEGEDRSFHAVLVDADGTRTDVERLTAGAATSLEGDLGRGRLRVPFDNIRTIQFEPADGTSDRMTAVVTLREGEPVTIAVRSATTFYGEAPGGAYQIRAQDLRTIELN